MVTLVNATYVSDPEKVPYRIKLAGGQPTLRQLKLALPKKQGQFRYYFKLPLYDEGPGQYAYEEMADDNQLLPLCDDHVVYCKVHDD